MLGEKVTTKSPRCYDSAALDGSRMQLRECQHRGARNLPKTRTRTLSCVACSKSSASNKVKFSIYTPRPGIVIGKKGAGIEGLKKDLQALSDNEIFVNIHEVRKAEVDAQLVAENVA